jgi:hypothetical protein
VCIKCAALYIFLIFVHSEGEKVRRWQEIKIRQHRLLAEADQTQPAHIEQIMKSGFTMSDIKGWFISATFSSMLLLWILLKHGKMFNREKSLNITLLFGETINVVLFVTCMCTINNCDALSACFPIRIIGDISNTHSIMQCMVCCQ